MTQLKKEIIENGIHYTLHGDYYFPDLNLPEAKQQAIGRYGRMRKAFLEESVIPVCTLGLSCLASCTAICRKSTGLAGIVWNG